jgi:hypothetical protein
VNMGTVFMKILDLLDILNLSSAGLGHVVA